MAITVDWPNRVINIPRADMALVQASPTEIRELSLAALHGTMRDLEASDTGIMYLPMHTYNPPVNIGGATLAPVVTIINDYTVTFEDGQYAVNLTAANSNVADRVNVNQVSVRASNSAGLVQSREIEHNSFMQAVYINAIAGASGTDYPKGTPLRPVNNLADAKAIATLRGFNVLHLDSDLTITAGEDISSYRIESNDWRVITLEAGAISDDTEFLRLSVYGEMSGSWNVLDDCWVFNITNFMGWVRGGSIERVELAPYVNPDPLSLGSSYFDNLVPMYANVPSALVMADDVSVSFTNCTDICEIQSMTAGSVVNAGVLGGKIIVAASCTGGGILVSGVGELENNSALAVDADNLVNNPAVWAHLIENGQSAEACMRIQNSVLAGKVSGMAGNAPVFRDLADVKNRVSATTDVSGNRLSVTLDGTP